MNLIPPAGKARILFLLEALAVVCGVAYTVTYAKGFIVCWVFAALGSSIFAYLCFEKRIYAEVLLRLFYVYMAWYGYAHWGEYGAGNSYTLAQHGMLIGSCAIATLVLGTILRRSTDAAMPYFDSFTTTFAVGATILMVNFIHETWLYWIVIDAISVYLYFKRGMKLASLLFVTYTMLAIAGYFNWL